MKKEAERSAPTVDRRKLWAKHAAKLALSLLVLAYVFSKVNLAEMRAVMGQVSWWVLGETLILNLLAVVYFQSLVNFYASPPANKISVKDFCADNMSISFYTLFLPAGLTFVIRWKKYTQRGMEGFASAAQVVFQKILQIWTSSLFMVAGLLVLINSSVGNLGILIPLAFAFMIVSTGVVATFMYGAPLTRWFAGFLNRVWRPLPNVLGKVRAFVIRCGQKIINACNEIQGLQNKRKSLVVLYACLQQLAVVLGAWVIVNSLHPGASFLAMMLVRSVIVLLMLLPVSVAGIGFREVSFVGLLPLFGISQEVALASSLLLFANTIVLGLIGGFFELISLKKNT